MHARSPNPLPELWDKQVAVGKLREGAFVSPNARVTRRFHYAVDPTWTLVWVLGVILIAMVFGASGGKWILLPILVFFGVLFVLPVYRTVERRKLKFDLDRERNHFRVGRDWPRVFIVHSDTNELPRNVFHFLSLALYQQCLRATQYDDFEWFKVSYTTSPSDDEEVVDAMGPDNSKTVRTPNPKVVLDSDYAVYLASPHDGDAVASEVRHLERSGIPLVLVALPGSVSRIATASVSAIVEEMPPEALPKNLRALSPGRCLVAAGCVESRIEEFALAVARSVREYAEEARPGLRLPENFVQELKGRKLPSQEEWAVLEKFAERSPAEALALMQKAHPAVALALKQRAQRKRG